MTVRLCCYSYASDCNIKMTVRGVQLGIKDLMVSEGYMALAVIYVTINKACAYRAVFAKLTNYHPASLNTIHG